MSELTTTDWIVLACVGVVFIVGYIYWRPRSKKIEKWNKIEQKMEYVTDEDGIILTKDFLHNFQLMVLLVVCLYTLIYYLLLVVFTPNESFDIGITTGINHIIFGLIIPALIPIGLYIGYRISKQSGKVFLVDKPIGYKTAKVLDKDDKEVGIKIVQGQDVKRSDLYNSALIATFVDEEGWITECAYTLKDAMNKNFVHWKINEKQLKEMKGVHRHLGDKYEVYRILTPYVEKYEDKLRGGRMVREIVPWSKDAEITALYNVGAMSEFTQIHNFNVSEQLRRSNNELILEQNARHQAEMDVPILARKLSIRKMAQYLVKLGIVRDSLSAEEISKEEHDRLAGDYMMAEVDPMIPGTATEEEE